jgi:hypothetical protein
MSKMKAMMEQIQEMLAEGFDVDQIANDLNIPIEWVLHVQLEYLGEDDML